MKAAIFQSDGAGLSPEARLDALDRAVAEAGADLVVCPELYLSGYAIEDEVRRHAQPPESPLLGRVAGIARARSSAIVIGYPERQGAEIFNAAVFVGAEGAVVARHRKLALPPGFEVGLFERGGGIDVFDYGGMRFAMLICYDAEFPECVRAARRGGADAVIVPTALGADWPSVALRLMPTRAFESGVWLLYANHAGVEGGTRYLGRSCIVGPDGEDAARAGAGPEVIAADLDRESVVKARARLPYLADMPAIFGQGRR